MATAVYRAGVLALYQLSILLGIALLPVALLARRVGVSLPVDRLLDRLGAAYSAAEEPTER
jgi:hypothetical protein